jgi:hydrogenase maturation factor
MTVVEARAEEALATCEDAEGSRSDVEIGLVDPVAAGDVLLVHAGTALARLDGRRAAA